MYPAASRKAATAVLLIAEMLAPLGIELDLKAVDATVLYAPATQGGLLESGKFDVALSGFQEYDDPDNSQEYSCESVAPAGFNIARYCEAAIALALTRETSAGTLAT